MNMRYEFKILKEDTTGYVLYPNRALNLIAEQGEHGSWEVHIERMSRHRASKNSSKKCHDAWYGLRITGN